MAKNRQQARILKKLHDKKPPSLNVTLGDERIANKLLQEEVELLASLKDVYGVSAEIRKQNILNGKDNATPKTIVQLALIGSSEEKRQSAKNALVRVAETLAVDEQNTIEKIIANPNTYVKKIDIPANGDDIKEMKSVLELAMASLEKDTRRSLKGIDAEAAKLINQARAAIEKKINSSTKVGLAPTHLQGIKEIYMDVLKRFPEDIGRYPLHTVEKFQAATEVLQNTVVQLADRETRHDNELANITLKAKQELSPVERKQLEQTILRRVEDNGTILDEKQKTLLMNSAFRAISAVTLGNEAVLGILESVRPATKEEAAILLEEQARQDKRDVYKQNALYGGKYVPMNDSQLDQVQNMKQNALSIVVGGAGSGKTMGCIAYALDCLSNDKDKTIVIFRPMRELGDGDTMGFLPGDELDKIGPYFRPILKNLLKLEPSRPKVANWLGLMKKGDEKESSNQVAALQALDKLAPTHAIQLTSMAYIRGETIDNAVIIVEEAQNLKLFEAEALITRAGKGTQIILAGDKIQTDMKLKDRHGNWLDEKDMPALPILIEAAKDNAGWMGVTIHPDENIVRSPLVKNAVGMFKNIREAGEDIYKKAFEGYQKDAVITFAKRPANGNGNGVSHEAKPALQ